jgi:hypothetical protein
MKKIIIMVLLISLMVGASTEAGAKAAGATVPSVYCAAGSLLVKPGATFSVPVSIKNVTDAYALGFDVAFDSDLVQLLSVAEGPFMGSSNTAFNYGSNIPGKLLIGISKYGKNVEGAKGTGLVFTLKFKALALGATKVDFSYCELFDSTANRNVTNCKYSPVTLVVSAASKIRKAGAKATLGLTVGKPTMTIDGKTGYALGGSPTLYKNVIYLPIKAIIEELGGTYAWNASTKNLIIRLNGKEINMFLNKSLARINGIPVIIDAKVASTYPRTFSGVNMVPMNFVLENLGIKSVYNSKLKTITLTYIAQ